MRNIEKALQLHEQNLQICELIESAITCLEHKMFESMTDRPYLTEGIPTQPIFVLCKQRNTIDAIIGSLQYPIQIEAVMFRLKQSTDIGIEEMVNAISDELLNSVIKRFSLG